MVKALGYEKGRVVMARSFFALNSSEAGNEVR